MSSKWSIARRQGTCSVSGRTFEDGERHASLLDVVEGELRRIDLSLEAWQAREEELLRTGAEGPLFWWTTRHRVEASRTLQLDLESLERLFVELEGRPETSVRELRYLLCLLLMRKRRVSIQKVERGPEGERMIVKRPRRDARFEVFVYDFEPERMEELRGELQAIFDGAEGPEGVRLDLEEGDGSGDDAEGASEDRPPGAGAATAAGTATEAGAATAATAATAASEAAAPRDA